MTQRPRSTSRSTNAKRPRAARTESRAASFARRLAAAGMSQDDPVPADADDFRYGLARRIHMAIDTWHGCPEALCRRHRGCMAPNNMCSNAEPISPEEMERRAPQAMAEVRTMLRDALAKNDGEGEGEK